MRPRRGAACLTIGLSLGAAVCTWLPSGSPTAGRLPPKPGFVKVTMADYRFVYANRVPAGRVVFTVSNVGQWHHQLSLYELADDAPPIGDQLRSSAAITSPPMVLMPALAPGAGGGSFAVDLEAGRRYALVSHWPSARGVPDALLGMATEFRAVVPSREPAKGPP